MSWYVLNRRLGVRRRRFEPFGEEAHLLPLSGNEPGFLGRPVRYSVCCNLMRNVGNYTQQALVVFCLVLYMGSVNDS
jgi:hypothetical protein